MWLKQQVNARTIFDFFFLSAMIRRGAKPLNYDQVKSCASVTAGDRHSKNILSKNIKTQGWSCSVFGFHALTHTHTERDGDLPWSKPALSCHLHSTQMPKIKYKILLRFIIAIPRAMWLYECVEKKIVFLTN